MPTAPYGAWESPIGAADLAAHTHPVTGAAFAGDEVWWSELRPAEGGRTAVRRHPPGSSGRVTDEPEDVLPAPWNARSRVHEYGGVSWAVVPGPRPGLVFVEFTDQRLYRLDAGSSVPVPLTPAGAGFRFAELTVVGNLVWCVRETHANDDLARDVCTVPLDGVAAQDASAVTSVVSGSRFLAYPRLSPDGRHLAWIAWDHPRMPWDGTELRVAELDERGAATSWRTVLGSQTESVLQPEWVDEHTLYTISDRTGWWNLYALDLASGAPPTVLHEAEAEIGGPLWQLGTRWYAPLPDGTILLVSTRGVNHLIELDPATGDARAVAPELTTAALTAVAPDGGTALVIGAASQRSPALYLLERGGAAHPLRRAIDHLPDVAWLPTARAMTFRAPAERGTREVQAFVYEPRSPRFRAPAGELPPYVAFVHGGPTGHVTGALSLTYAYFTSRGIGVVDVNYGGSTGYGREYCERLRGQWGVVDVEDTVTAVLGLADAGLADRDRLAIEGGSAGGWTVLAALTRTDVFACGASYFGVAELKAFREETHDFESRYLDGLIGPWPESAELYRSRAPLTHVDALDRPVLLLQSLDDPIVPPAQAERFRDALAAKGVPHAYLAYEGESHGFRRAETITHAREAELSFYGQVLGFAPPGVPVLELTPPVDSGSDA
ncbi:MAG: prolyl oligopeptidase family serine peptidase [Cellulomonadaceae bacterium]